MTQVKLTEKGIGPFQYRGYNYWVAPASHRVLRRWGLRDIDASSYNVPWLNNYTPGTLSLTDGRVNTNSMNDTEYPAAHYTRSIGPDWFLPSKCELNKVIYKNKDKIDEVDTTIFGRPTSPSLANIVAFTARDGSNPLATNLIWTSTETSSFNARFQRFSDGYSSYTSKLKEHWVIGIYKEPINDNKDQFKEEVTTTSSPSSKTKEILKFTHKLVTSENFNSLDMDTTLSILDILEVLIKEK